MLFAMDAVRCHHLIQLGRDPYDGNPARCSCPSWTRTGTILHRPNIRYSIYNAMQRLWGVPNLVCNRCVTSSSTFLSRISLAGIPSNYPDNYGTPAEAYHPCGTKCGSRGIINAGSREAVPVIKQPAVYFRRTGPSHINRAVEVEFLTNPSTRACGHGNHRAKTFI